MNVGPPQKAVSVLSGKLEMHLYCLELLNTPRLLRSNTKCMSYVLFSYKHIYLPRNIKSTYPCKFRTTSWVASIQSASSLIVYGLATVVGIVLIELLQPNLGKIGLFMTLF